MILPAIGLLLWIAVLFVVFVLCGSLWVLSRIITWLMDLAPGISGRRAPLTATPSPAWVSAGPVRAVPARAQAHGPAPSHGPAPARATSHSQGSPDLWPKWTPSHRRYKDEELSLWQDQFDALASHRFSG